MKPHHSLILFLLLLAGCSSNSNLTSFGNRKYTKGYFWNNPTKIDDKAKAGIEATETKTEGEKINEAKQAQPKYAAIKEYTKTIVAVKKAVLNNLQNKGTISATVNKTERIDDKTATGNQPDERTEKSHENKVGLILLSLGILLSILLIIIASSSVIGIGIYPLLILGITSIFFGISYLVDSGKGTDNTPYVPPVTPAPAPPPVPANLPLAPPAAAGNPAYVLQPAEKTSWGIAAFACSMLMVLLIGLSFALVSSLSYIVILFVLVAIIPAILGVIFGIISLGKPNDYHGLAIASLVISGILVLGLVH